MSSTSDIWFAFARTFSVLFAVLALLILIFYIIKKVSLTGGSKKGGSYINVLSMHHLSPKEKLVLLDVLGETILIGVTPNRISKLTSVDTQIDFSNHISKKKTRFSEFLSHKLGRFSNAENGVDGQREGHES